MRIRWPDEGIASMDTLTEVTARIYVPHRPRNDGREAHGLLWPCGKATHQRPSVVGEDVEDQRGTPSRGRDTILRPSRCSCRSLTRSLAVAGSAPSHAMASSQNRKRFHDALVDVLSYQVFHVPPPPAILEQRLLHLGGFRSTSGARVGCL